MSNEIAAGNQHHNEWLNSNLSTSIPRQVPMGENLKIEWTPTDRVSSQPLRIPLDESNELQVHWQEYRWVKELELLGQLYLNKQLLYLSERCCFKTDDALRPFNLYRRDKQKSICVTKLVLALQDPEDWQLQILHPTPSVFVLYFHEGEQCCSLALDIDSHEAQIYSTDCYEFPDEAPNGHQEQLHADDQNQALRRALAATQPDCSFMGMSKTTKSAKLDGSEDPEIAKWNSSSRIPPFTPSGLPRVDLANKYIRAPFKDGRVTANPLLTIKKGVEL